MQLRRVWQSYLNRPGFELTPRIWTVTARRSGAHSAVEWLATANKQLNLLVMFFGQELLYFVSIGQDMLFQGANKPSEEG